MKNERGSKRISQKMMKSNDVNAASAKAKISFKSKPDKEQGSSLYSKNPAEVVDNNQQVNNSNSNNSGRQSGYVPQQTIKEECDVRELLLQDEMNKSVGSLQQS